MICRASRILIFLQCRPTTTDLPPLNKNCPFKTMFEAGVAFTFLILDLSVFKKTEDTPM